MLNVATPHTITHSKIPNCIAATGRVSTAPSVFRHAPATTDNHTASANQEASVYAAINASLDTIWEQVRSYRESFGYTCFAGDLNCWPARTDYDRQSLRDAASGRFRPVTARRACSHWAHHASKE